MTSTYRPLLLDLFCCAGGAAKGYHDAGFDVVGVDIVDRPNYPYVFVKRDAIEVLEDLNAGYGIETEEYGALYMSDFSGMHLSPPCQGYSITKHVRPENVEKYPMLIPLVRLYARASGVPYVIENVEGAKRDMINPLTLCGSQFGMAGERNGHRAYIRRHRLFETNFIVPEAGPHDHDGLSVAVYGHGAQKGSPLRGPGFAKFARGLMGMDWGTWHELAESIPPAFSEYVGKFMMEVVK